MLELDHVRKRETPVGRWLPAALYAVNVLLWIITALAAGAWDRWWLAIWPLPALGLYWWRTRRTGYDS